MSSLVQDQVEDPASTASTASTAMENRLDELIPRPAPAWQKVLGGALVLTLAVVGSLLWSFGYLVPMQTLQNGSSSERLTVSTHEGEPAVLVTKRIWNPTKRDVRMTDFVVDATGIDLLTVQARLEPESPEPEYGNCTTTGDTTTCVSLTPGIDCTRMQSNAGDTTEVCQVAHDQGYDPTVIPPRRDSAPVGHPGWKRRRGLLHVSPYHLHWSKRISVGDDEADIRFRRRRIPANSANDHTARLPGRRCSISSTDLRNERREQRGQRVLSRRVSGARYAAMSFPGSA